MIKVNLLDSVTNRAKGVAAVEQKVANPRMQTLLLALVVFGLLTAGMLYDYYGATSARETQLAEIGEQERIQAQMVAVNKERTDLEKKMSDVQARIDAIQALRSSQQGPGAVLREIKLRFDSVPGLYLRSVEQKGTEVMIKGESPNETAVMNFGKSLEFSSGLFTNLNIETQREEAKMPAASSTSSPVAGSPVAGSPVADAAPKPEVVSFTIKCTYVPGAVTPASGAPGTTTPTNNIAQNN